MTEKKKLTLELIKQLHKPELHCHLDGSLSVDSIMEMAEEQGVDLGFKSKEDLAKVVEVDIDCPSLVVYLNSFGVTLKVMQTPHSLTRSVYEVSEAAYRDGISYLELRFSPVLHLEKGMDLALVMESICEGVALVEKTFPIVVRIIVCGMRHMDPKVTESLAEICWRYHKKGVTGFDLAGPEDGFSSKHHRSAFHLVSRKMINLTLHAGEAYGWESIYDSIRYCGAHRIGHGVRLYENEELKNYVRDKEIPLECCVTSNFQTKAISAIEKHPIKQYFDYGILTVPCTDNVTVSKVKLSEEYFKIQELFGFEPEELIRMADYGFAKAFVDNTIRKRLRVDALYFALNLLKQNGFSLDKFFENHVYYERAGVNLALFKDPPIITPFSIDPPITLEIIQKLPKADLHCRLDGSVSIDTVWDEIQKDPNWFKLFKLEEIKSKEELIEKLQPERHTAKSFALAKKIMLSVCQTKEQIQRAVDNIYAEASKDNVQYLELMFRPLAHIHKMKAEEVMQIVLEESKKASEQYKIRTGIVVYVSIPEDDPISFFETAKLGIQYKNQGVMGFGSFGDDIPFENYKFYEKTFSLLKKHNMNVCILAGQKTPDSIVAALSEGGSSRVSGAFKMHEIPKLVSHLVNHNILVEVSPTDKLSVLTENISTFSGSPIELFVHSGLPVTLCSFRLTLDKQSRSQVIQRVVKENQFDIADLLRIVAIGFRNNFSSRDVQVQMHIDFWKFAQEFLPPLGFKQLRKFPWMPKKKN
ncbi:adenosine deaminase [Anaeramoeba ignava]|uniref:adenosine deaminase n=1 Tax=Anaeramoeba ignava TaxID=1746090 RepID=A0A9Q0RA71_ANAIG|nr:adenosine deaminase [Anaeramoeba ignava]|eukprot:Anaeramoba_ignava/a480005_1134.p1 GENE.a480005_1134~~a480005_1134.p1  ORF type:complete len:755 (-),score=183.81 a480005_1134:250-2514(-)